MRKRINSALIGIFLWLVAATTAHAVVLCAKPHSDGTFNTSVRIREACKTGETQLDAAALGVQGEQGPVGPQGPAGPQGLDGPQGADGTQGAQGPEGAQGPQGVAGPQGVQGAQGPQGNDGAPGPQGMQGVAGSPGQACWDLNGSATCDAGEDINGDSSCDVFDCLPSATAEQLWSWAGVVPSGGGTVPVATVPSDKRLVITDAFVTASSTSFAGFFISDQTGARFRTTVYGIGTNPQGYRFQLNSGLEFAANATVTVFVGLGADVTLTGKLIPVP